MSFIKDMHGAAHASLSEGRRQPLQKRVKEEGRLDGIGRQGGGRPAASAWCFHSDNLILFVSMPRVWIVQARHWRKAASGVDCRCIACTCSAQAAATPPVKA